MNGGSAVSFEADGQNDLSVAAGTYSVTEPAVTGYTTSYSNCSNLVIPNGGSATCTITNNDQAATLIVKKVVVNDNGGTKVAVRLLVPGERRLGAGRSRRMARTTSRSTPAPTR